MKTACGAPVSGSGMGVPPMIPKPTGGTPVPLPERRLPKRSATCFWVGAMVLLALSWACAAEEFSGLNYVDFYAKAGERPSEAMTPVPGPTPGKTALRLDRCSLVGKAPAGLSVELWLRVLGPGSIHDYASGPTGTLCSVGNGHCDGWRLVCLDGKERFSLHVGQPTGPLILDFRVPESDKWFKLVLVQDGQRVSVLKDGQQLATREFQGKLIPAAALVVGHDIGHGWGSVKFELGGLKF